MLDSFPIEARRAMRLPRVATTARLEEQYARALWRWLGPVREADRELLEEYERLEAERADSLEWLRSRARQLAARTSQALGSAAAVVGRAAERTSTFVRRQVDAVLEVAGVAPRPLAPRVATAQAWAERNAVLVVALPAGHGTAVEGLLDRAWAERWSPTRLRDELVALERRLKGTATQIATEQVRALAAATAHERQQEQGITHYVWLRTTAANPREEHLQRVGQVYAWDDPPEDGHPGTLPGCQCGAAPVAPQFSPPPGARSGRLS